MRKAMVSGEARQILAEVAAHYRTIRGFAAQGVHVTESSQGSGGQKTTSPLELLYRAPNLFRLTHGDQEIEGANRDKARAPFLMEHGCTGNLIYRHTRGVSHSSLAVAGSLRIEDGDRIAQELCGLVWNLPVLFAIASDPVGVILSEARAVSAESDALSGETRLVVEGRMPLLCRAELVLDGVLGLVWFEYRMSGGGRSVVARDEFESFKVGEIAVERFAWKGPEGTNS